MDGLNFPIIDDYAGKEVAPAVKKIAILGSASSCLELAPWADESWTIWACSGATQPRMKRYDAFFELHDYASCKAIWTPEFVAFLQKSEKPVYMHEPHPEIPASIRFPKDELIATFGRFFFTSSIAWMLAFALQEDAKEIGLWGVDMASDGEYEGQRPGCQHFITAAMHRGIEITLPPESSLLNPPPLYGCAPRHPYTVQAIALTQRLATEQTAAQGRYEASVRDVKYWEGFSEANRHWMKMLEQDPKSVVGG